MNTLELAKAIGRIGLLRDSRRDISFTVRVTDAREVYGRVQYLVTPLSGQGSVWTDSDQITCERDNTI